MLTTPACRREASSRLPTSRCSRSAPASMVASSSAVSAGGPGDVVLAQAADRRLHRRPAGCAGRGPTPASREARIRSAASSCAASAARAASPTAVQRAGGGLGEAGEHPPVGGEQFRPADPQHQVARRTAPRSSRLGAGAASPSPLDLDDAPLAARRARAAPPPACRTPAGPAPSTSVRVRCSARVGPGEAGQRLGLRAGAGRLGGAAGGDVDDPAHRDRDDQVDGQDDDLLGGLHRQRPERRGEEPVQQQRAGHRPRQGDPHAAEQCAGDHEDQDEQHRDGVVQVLRDRLAGRHQRQQPGDEQHRAGRRRPRPAKPAGSARPKVRRRADGAGPVMGERRALLTAVERATADLRSSASIAALAGGAAATGTLVTITPGWNSSRAFSRSALWLCSSASHQCPTTYSGTNTLTTSRGDAPADGADVVEQRLGDVAVRALDHGQRHRDVAADPFGEQLGRSPPDRPGR